MLALEDFKVISKSLQNDRLGKEKNWTKWEKQYMEKLPSRTGVGREELPTINLNETFRAAFTCTRYTVKGLWNNNRLYQTGATGKDDIALSELLDFFISHKIRHIKDIFLTLLFTTLQNFVLGTTAGKFKKTDRGKFGLDYISVFDIWLDNEVSKYSDLRHIMHRVPLSKRELEARVNNGIFDGKAVKKYLAEMVKRDKEDEIKERKSYDTYELWYLRNGEWNVTTAGTHANKDDEDRESVEPIMIFRDEKSDLIYGHPFCLSFDIPSLTSPFYGHSESEILRDIQEGENRLFNLNLDFIQSSIRPPALFEPDAIDDTADLEALLAPESGGVIPVENVARIKPWLPANLSPQSFGMIGALKQLADDMSGIPGIIHGEEPAHREPATTTIRRTELAHGTLGFKMLIFGETFMKQLGEKMLMSILDDPPEKEIFRLTGVTPTTYIQIQQGEPEKDKPRVAEEEMTFGGKDVKVLVAKLKKMSKKEIREFVDIEIRPAFLEEPDEMKKRRYLETLQFFMQALQVAPELKVWVNMRDFLRQIFKMQGMEIETLFRSPEEAMEIFIKMAQQGGMGAKS